MSRNPILDEIHAVREKLLAAFQGDLHAYIAAARRRTLESGRPVFEPRPESRKSAALVGDKAS